ncbi:hypothetical protein DFH28DRAFT_891825 [Melampsora americana]|nr:hypothetical protein DFH28DRAFT_891825 [Melampsora americana]
MDQHERYNTENSQPINPNSKDCNLCHNKRKNASCRNNACAECCAVINNSIGCNPHTKQRNRKLKDGTSGDKPHKSQVMPMVDNVDPALRPPAALPATRDGQHVDLRYTNGASYHHFRDVNIQDQAEERVNNAAKQSANQTISIYFWATQGQEVHHWRIPVPSWPRFKLDQSPMLVRLAEEHVGPSWNRHLRVWNDAGQDWALTDISAMDEYPVEFRKVLVMIPGTDISCCEDLQRHIDSVTTRSTKERTKLHPYVTPTNTNYNIIFVDGSPTPQRINKGDVQKSIMYLDDCTPSPSQDAGSVSDTMQQSKADQHNVNHKAHHQDIAMDKSPAPQIAFLLEDQDPTPTPTPTPAASYKPKWPEGVTMSKAKELIDATQPPLKLTSRKAWNSLFQDSHQKYSKSTVTYYLRWLRAIDATDKNRLSDFVRTNGHNLMIETRDHHFNEEWKKCDTRRDDGEGGEEEEDIDKDQPNKKRKIDSITL